jgi:predicted PurR-regulated permease PerM
METESTTASVSVLSTRQGPARDVHNSETKGFELHQVLICLIGVGFILHFLQAVLIPFTLAIFLTFLLSPLVSAICGHGFGGEAGHSSAEHEIEAGGEGDSLDATEDTDGLLSGEKKEPAAAAEPFSLCGVQIWPLPRVVGVIIALLIGLTFLGAVVWIIMKSIQTLQDSNRIALYAKEAQKYEMRILKFANERLHIDGTAVIKEMRKQINLGELASSLVGFAAGFLEFTVVVIIFLIFMLMENTREYTPAESEGKSTLQSAVISSVTRYIWIHSIMSGIIAILTWITLGLLGIPLAAFFGLLAFILNWIPNVGAIFALLLPLPILLLDPTISTTQGVLALLIPAFIHTVIGQFIEMWIFSEDEDIDLHPLAVLLAVAIWYAVWGVAGAMIAVPITACLRIVFRKSEAKFNDWFTFMSSQSVTKKID